jgi:hypothetical protein
VHGCAFPQIVGRVEHTAMRPRNWPSGGGIASAPLIGCYSLAPGAAANEDSHPNVIVGATPHDLRRFEK